VTRMEVMKKKKDLALVGSSEVSLVLRGK